MPKDSIRMRGHVVDGAAMPEAAVDKHGNLSPSKCDINAATTVAGHRPVDPVPQPGAMEEVPQLQLRTSVAATVGLHIPAYCGRSSPAMSPHDGCWIDQTADRSIGEMWVHASSVLQQAAVRSNIGARVTSDVTGDYKWLVDAFRGPTAPTHART